MAVTPPPPAEGEYYPPPDHDCEELPGFPIVISGTERIAGRALEHRGKVVDFSISLQIRDASGAVWVEVARIDCRHGTVHKHQFNRSGREAKVTKIRDIPSGSDEEAWDVVDSGYDSATELFTTQAESHVRAWRKS